MQHHTLWQQICSFENLHLAYLKARRCKRYKKDILQFGYHLEENLLKLQNNLQSGNYTHGSYKEFIVQDSKKRHIMAAPFKDRVMHHALCNIIEPVFDKSFIFDSYACRKNKGTCAATARLRNFLNTQNYHRLYILKCDISKYFANINHKILLELIKKKIKDQKTVELVHIIISSANEKIGKGIPIGNLTSQLFANIYLNELDKFIKHKLKAKHYLRYMDDLLILDFDKKKLALFKKQINKFVTEELWLKLHLKKSVIFPAHIGIDFLGYIFYQGKVRLRKSTVYRFIKRKKIYLKKLNLGLMTANSFCASLASWKGYAKRANSWRLCNIMFSTPSSTPGLPSIYRGVQRAVRTCFNTPEVIVQLVLPPLCHLWGGTGCYIRLKLSSP